MAISKGQRDLRHTIMQAAPGLLAAESLFDSLNDVLFCVKDLQRRYVAANTAFLRSAGVSSLEEILGRGATNLFPAALAAGYELQDDEVLSTGHAVQNKLEMITRADGAVGWFLSQKVPVRDARGKILALAGVSRDLATPAERGATLDPLAAAIEYVQRHFAQPLKVMQLAETVGLSISQFERRVREMTGLSPRQLLTKVRIEAAATALRSSETSLNEIALACGFYDQATFSRQFRKATGTTPGEYRRAFSESLSRRPLHANG